MSANWGVSFSIGQIKDSLSTDELKRLYQIQNGFELYAGTDSIAPLQRYYTGYEESQAGKHTKMPELAKYWQENAGYIKKNLKNLEKDTYSIIITRYPVDVMRMADFNNIISCHSPKSRDASAGFFKCAVAEARGHGALAYVVETDKLLEITDSESIEAAEGKIQEGEIFADETRGSHIGLYHPKLELLPVSRIRLRQMRYYDTDTLRIEFYQVERLDDGVWVGHSNYAAYGSDMYTVEATTLNDSTDFDPGVTTFRIIANMDEGNWESESAEGYSIDNLIPEIPTDFRGLAGNGYNKK